MKKKKDYQRWLIVAKLALIEAIVNAVLSAVRIGTVHPKVIARAASASLVSEVAQAELLLG
ncbi:Hypothetical predicted protein [Prunus dulcis]|uniref:Uncharacterized protein n=1 Tax=Prunus dulcis TaxID=3755 RepID=A0A5E4ENG2_PRUDU|nr:Hypothetical predicted protein [Prunus dulcis]